MHIYIYIYLSNLLKARVIFEIDPNQNVERASNSIVSKTILLFLGRYD